ncbi:MAG: hypothetical protein LBQ84_09655 [Flavobacteriaceae bacterium]|jgi:hypothetical protein|nr:hypothetical protein [Flavobacteriaceae bacterium]
MIGLNHIFSHIFGRAVQLFDKPLASFPGICCIRFALVAMAFGAARMEAQVIIGGTSPAKEGTLLDLNSDTKGGLLLSNVYLENLTKIPESFPGISGLEEQPLADAREKFTGAIVYNANSSIGQGTGIYEWSDTKWNYYVSGKIDKPTETITGTISTTTPLIIGELGDLEIYYILKVSRIYPMLRNNGGTEITVPINAHRAGGGPYDPYGYSGNRSLMPSEETDLYNHDNVSGLYYRIWIYNPEIDKELEFETRYISATEIMIRYISKGD